MLKKFDALLGFRRFKASTAAACVSPMLRQDHRRLVKKTYKKGKNKKRGQGDVLLQAASHLEEGGHPHNRWGILANY